MKKIFFLIACCLLSMTAIAQNDINQIDKNGKKQGPWKKYENGVLVYEGQFVNDVPKGTFKYYFADGKLKSVTEFLVGVSKVKVVTYHKNGEIASEGIFIDQQKDGQWRYYSDKKVLLSEENYKSGKKNGTFTTYSMDGYKLKIENYLNDELDGECISYYEREQVFTVMHYINGKVNGEVVSYYPNGKISKKGLYHNNLKYGIWDTFDEQEHTRSSDEYDQNGQIVKSYLYFINHGNSQKINKSMVAYLQDRAEKGTVIRLKNGNLLESDESFTTVLQWIDFLEFIKITPKLFASVDCIRGYKDIDENTVAVKLEPALDYEVIAQDEDAKFVRSLFAVELPKEEK